MEEFDFKPFDFEGEETLRTMALADRFNEWMYDTIRPHCTGQILEIGSGVGNISEFFVRDKARIMLSDIRDLYCKSLRARYKSTTTTLGIENMNLVDSEFDHYFRKYFGEFNTVFALNVVEHIFDDKLAISNCYKLLKPGGKLVILVPAYQSLYNGFDEELEHYRRYNREQLESIFRSCNFLVTHSQYFNAAGIAGWYISGKLLNNKTIPRGQMKVFNTLAPVFKIFDKVIFNSFGLSVITVGQK